MAIIDNFKPHHSPETMMRAAELKIYLVYLPSYSPDLNPIGFIWKPLKRQISNTFISSEMHLKHIVQALFYRFSSSLSFAKSWIEEFLSEEFIKCIKLAV